LQMLIAVLLLKATHFSGLMTMPKIEFEVAKSLAPLIAINVLGLGVNTLCLVYVDTSFYQVCVCSPLVPLFSFARPEQELLSIFFCYLFAFAFCHVTPMVSK